MSSWTGSEDCFYASDESLVRSPGYFVAATCTALTDAQSLLQEAQQALNTALYQEAAQVSANVCILTASRCMLKSATADAEHTLHRECWR